MIDERSKERAYMVSHQLMPRGISSSRVLDAMSKVPRHHFIPSNLQAMAYDDKPLPIGEEQTISQPFIVALMSQLAQIKPDARVLEIGTGSGYGAAILAQLAKEVYTIERLHDLSTQAKEHLHALGYANITCLVGDGTLGWPEKAPYDAILVTAGAPHIPKSLQQQLAIGGSLIIPVGDSTSQSLMKIERRSQEHYAEEFIEPVRFVPLIGAQGWSAGPVF